MHFLVLFFVLFVFPYSPLHAGAWTVAPGKWEHYHDITYYSTDHYYDTQGNRRQQPRYSKFEMGNRLEHGLYDGLTVGGTLNFASVKGSQDFIFPSTSPFTGPTTVTVRRWNLGIADPTLYARQRLWQNDTSVLSTQATVKFPSTFRWNNLPRSGSDKFSGELRLLGGHNFAWNGQSHFSNLEVAYEWRPQNTGDLIHADATLGFHLTPQLMILPQIFSTWRAAGGDTRFTQTGNDSYDLVKGQLSAVTPIARNIYLQFGGFHHLYARNTGGGDGATLSLWVKR